MNTISKTKQSSNRQSMKQIERLEIIASNLIEIPEALGLIGLGSVGAERERLDEFSDLDFFVVVKDRKKQPFLSNLAWLETADYRLDFHFQDTPDGVKVIWSDGLYGESAVFTLAELSKVLAAGAKVIWQRENVELEVDFEKNIPVQHKANYYFTDAATNIYVAQLRFRRGEVLSADSLMASALSNLMKGISLSKAAQADFVDKFDKSHRFEQNFPVEAQEIQKIFGNLEQFDLQTKKILSMIERFTPINSALKAVIEGGLS